MFNEAPLPGWIYVMVPVTFMYVGATSSTPWLGVDVDFLGSDNVIFDAMSGDQWCGAVPNAASAINELYPGGTATGNTCAVVPTPSIAGGKWRLRTGYATAERFVDIH